MLDKKMEFFGVSCDGKTRIDSFTVTLSSRMAGIAKMEAMLYISIAVINYVTNSQIIGLSFGEFIVSSPQKLSKMR